MLQIRKGKCHLEPHRMWVRRIGRDFSLHSALQRSQSKGPQGWHRHVEMATPLFHVEQKVVSFENIKSDLRTCFRLAWLIFKLPQEKQELLYKYPYLTSRNSQLKNRGNTSLDQHCLSISAALCYWLYFPLSAHSILCSCNCSWEQQVDLLEFSSSDGLQNFTGPWFYVTA